jgi:hypothetical protein
LGVLVNQQPLSDFPAQFILVYTDLESVVLGESLSVLDEHPEMLPFKCMGSFSLLDKELRVWEIMTEFSKDLL